MKIIFIILFCFSSLYAKYCFKDKSANKIICYEKYFQRDNIYKSKNSENYYTSKNGNIYAIDDKIEIKFNTIGAIISLEKDFEIDFYDKLKNDTYIFKVRNPYELFSILSNLNRLDSIQKAVPQVTKKYTQVEVQRRIEERKARLKKVMQKTKMKEKQKKEMSSKDHTLPKNFLSGEH